jgi:serine phosphatase RsbU (regulator of sigma subunit)/DNA-binding response OmpR family regulator
VFRLYTLLYIFNGGIAAPRSVPLLQRLDHNLARETRLKEIKILALDDDLFIHRMLRSIFHDNYRFKVVATVAEFNENVSSFDPDIVLIDVVLPDGNGIEVCRWLREQAKYEQLFILMLTSFEDVQSIESAYRAGANDYIRKPFIPFEISSKIHQISRIINYQHGIVRLYNHQRISNKRLYLLTDCINRYINATEKVTFLESAFEVASFIRCDYCELLYTDVKGPEQKKRRYTEGFTEITFDVLSPHLQLFKDDSREYETLKIGRTVEQVIHCFVAKLRYNKNLEGYLMLQGRRAFPKEVIDLVLLYLDFVNIMGVDLTVKQIMRSEIHKDRKEIAKVRSLQVSLLPNFAEIDRFDISSTFIPMDEISGDFFDGFYTSDMIYQIILCDVSGHGVASSFIGSSIRGLLRAADYSRKTPSQIVNELNNSVVKNLASVYYFSSMILCTLNITTGEVILVSAGHPPCFYFNREQHLYERIENTGPLVGLIVGSVFEEHHLTLNPGDGLFLYTDGIIEAPGEETGEHYGEERLFKFFKEYIDRPSIEIVHAAIGSVYEHTGFTSLNDDATLICIKRKD